MSESVIEEAARLTSTDRQDIYGHPADDFAKVAQMIKPIMESDIDPKLKHALYMVQVKIARLLNTPNHRDSIVDGIGYFNTYAMILDRDTSPIDGISAEDFCRLAKQQADRTI